MTAASIVEGNICTVRAWYSSGNQAAVNTFHYLAGVETGVISVQDFATQFDALISPVVKNLVPNSTTYNGIQVYVNQLPLPLPGVSIAGAGVGTATGTELPPQTCGLLQWKTDYAGPANRGRTYFPFPTTADDASGGIPTSTYLSQLDTFATYLISLVNITSGGNSLAVSLILKHGKNKAGVTPPPTPITGHHAFPVFATMQKRGYFGRPNKSPI